MIVTINESATGTTNRNEDLLVQFNEPPVEALQAKKLTLLKLPHREALQIYFEIEISQ